MWLQKAFILDFAGLGFGLGVEAQIVGCHRGIAIQEASLQCNLRRSSRCLREEAEGGGICAVANLPILWRNQHYDEQRARDDQDIHQNSSSLLKKKREVSYSL